MLDHQRQKCARCLLFRQDVYDHGEGWTLCGECYDALYADSDYAERITHEGQYEDEPCDEAVQVLPNAWALASRSAAGLLVEVERGLLTVSLDGKTTTAVVSDDKLWDAFNHPALYLGAVGCEAIGLK